MKRFLCSIFCAVLLTGCVSGDVDDATPGAGEDWTPPLKAESLPDFPHVDYTFTYSYSSMAMQYTAVSRVTAGEVESVEIVEPPMGSPQRFRALEEFSEKVTISFIIEDLRQSAETGAIEVVWDETLDYPSEAHLDPLPGIDDESSWVIESVDVVERAKST